MPAAGELVPRSEHRVDHDAQRTELLSVSMSASEDALHRALVLDARRLAHALVVRLLASPGALPGAVGISPPAPDDYGLPEDPAGSWTLALVDPDDARRLRCEDIEGDSQALGAFSLEAWQQGVMENAVTRAQRALARHAGWLRHRTCDLHGPPAPHRTLLSPDLADLFAETRQQSAVIEECEADDGALWEFMDALFLDLHDQAPTGT